MPLQPIDDNAQLRQALASLRANLVVPLLMGNTLTGILTLGEKRSGEPYSQEDIDLLVALSQSAALALEKSRLCQERLETLHHQLAQVTAAQEEERRRIARSCTTGLARPWRA